jgi:hypothetical protein
MIPLTTIAGSIAWRTVRRGWSRTPGAEVQHRDYNQVHPSLRVDVPEHLDEPEVNRRHYTPKQRADQVEAEERPFIKLIFRLCCCSFFARRAKNEQQKKEKYRCE